MSTPDAPTCKHPKIQTFRFTDTGEPAGLWGCVDCHRKFAPLDVEAAAEIERLRADAARYQWLRLKVYVCPKERILRIADTYLKIGAVPEMLDSAIDAAMRDAP